MLKKYVSLFLSCLLAVCTANFAGFGIFAQAREEPDAESLSVSLVASDDCYIRKDKADENFGDVLTLASDIREGSRRYSLIRFDAAEIKTAVDTASKVMFRFSSSKVPYNPRFLVYPLYGDHRVFDENTLTWSVATGIMHNGTNLATYLQNPLPQLPPEWDSKWCEYDVTDYVKSQTDYLYGFKIWGTPGDDNYVKLKSKESAGFEPCLVFYTEVNYIVEQAASETLASIPVNSVTDDFLLPTVWDNSDLLQEECRIEWESSNEEILRLVETEDGILADVFQRPEESDQTVELTMRILYRGEVKEQKVNVLILRRGMVPLSGDTYTTGGAHAQQNHGKEDRLYCGNIGMEELDREIYVQFDALTDEEKQSDGRILLRLFPDNSTQLQHGRIYAAGVSGFDGNVEELTAESAAGFTELTEAVAVDFSSEKTLDFDVTDIISRDGGNVFKLWSDEDEIQFYSSDSEFPAQLVVLDREEAAMYDAVEKIREEFLTERAHVTEDISLPQSEGGFSVQWSSADESLLRIESARAAVERPPYEEGDKSTLLTLTLSDGVRSFSFDYYLVIARSEPDGVNGRRKLKDPMHLSDEDFFGKWNDTLGSYEKPPVLQYDSIEGLSEIEYYARRGNYALAKEELLAYYRGRDKNLRYEVEPSDKLPLGTRLATEYIIGNQSPLSVFSVDSEPQWHEISMPVGSGIQQSYMLFDRSKDGSTGVFYSQNTDYAPYLKVVTSDKTLILPCTADTYMEGMENRDKVNGKDALLLVHEEGNPFNGESKRTYLNFDLTQVTGKENIKAIFLMVYGRKMGGKSNEMQMIVYDAPLAAYMDENTAKWSDITPGTFNLNDCIYDWSAPYGSESEWINSLARQEKNVSMVEYYLATGDEACAAVALENTIGIYTYQNPGFPRALDTGWRTPALLATTFGLIDSEYMTPEVFCALIKYAYEMLQFLDTASTPSVVNQINAVDTGYTRLVIYYPEIHDASYYEKSRARHDQTFSAKIMHDDGAYREATSGYMHRVIAEMQEVIEMYEKAGYTDLESWKEYAHKLAVFYGNCMFPDGEMVPYGDGGRTKNFDLLWKYGEFFDDDMLRYQSKKQEMKEPEDYQSVLFPIKKLAIMRDGWNKNALFADITAETGHSHGHPDDLHMNIYAYGRPLLIDAGNGGGYNPLSPAGLVRTETFAHNTVEINGKAQSYDIGENGLSMTINGSFDRAVGFAETNVGYRHTRKVFFLHGGFWIVSDIIVPEDETQTSVYRQNWHPDNYANLKVDAQTGRAQTHFSGTANLTILQADMDQTKTEINRSYIKDKNQINRMENYVAYTKTTKGTAVFDTLLYPTEAGKESDVSFARLPMENTAPETASAMSIDYQNKHALYYLSNEETPQERSFGGYTFDGELAYIETNADGSLSYLAAVNGSRLTDSNGNELFVSEDKIRDIAVRKIGTSLQINTSDTLDCDIRIRPSGAVSDLTLNGVVRAVEWDNGSIVLHSEKTVLPISVDGTKMSYTFTEDFVKSLAIYEKGETKKVTVTIPAGTKVSAALGWDGKLDFSVNEGDTLTVRLDANQPLSFDRSITLDVPFYSSSGAYYISGAAKRSFGDGKAEISGNDEGSRILTRLGGDFVFTRLIGALQASGSMGKGSGGGSAGGSAGGPSGGAETTEPSAPPTQEPSPETDIPDSKKAFTDISGHWAEESICALKEQGMLSGDGDGKFRPDDTLTRAEFVKMLVCAVGETAAYDGKFTDVAGDEWFAPYVQAAAQSGIVSGYADGSFRPNGTVTREEAAKMLVEGLKLTENTEENMLSRFADWEDVSAWAAPYLEQAVNCGIFRGTDDGKIEPKSELTRAMAAAVLYRMLAAVRQEG